MLAREVDVVEHRQQRLEHGGHRRVAGDVPVALDPAAVVDVLRLQSLQVVEALRREGLERLHVRRGAPATTGSAIVPPGEEASSRVAGGSGVLAVPLVGAPRRPPGGLAATPYASRTWPVSGSSRRRSRMTGPRSPCSPLRRRLVVARAPACGRRPPAGRVAPSDRPLRSLVLVDDLGVHDVVVGRRPAARRVGAAAAAGAAGPAEPASRTRLAAAYIAEPSSWLPWPGPRAWP